MDFIKKMGNCAGKKSKDHELPVKGYEEHVTSRHALRVGLQFGKDSKGEMQAGFKGRLKNEKDVVVKVDGEDEEINKIPKVLDIVNDEQ